MIHYSNAIMGAMASHITSLTIFCSIVYSGTDQRKHQNSESLAFVWEIHRWPVNSPHKWPATQKIFPFDDVIMFFGCRGHCIGDLGVQYMLSFLQLWGTKGAAYVLSPRIILPCGDPLIATASWYLFAGDWWKTKVSVRGRDKHLIHQ